MPEKLAGNIEAGDLRSRNTQPFGKPELGDQLLEEEVVWMSTRLVGRVHLTDALRMLREAMFARALEQCDGNRTAAARILGVDRRYVARACRDAQ